jgi:uncharacterized OB-fold protein
MKIFVKDNFYDEKGNFKSSTDRKCSACGKTFDIGVNLCDECFNKARNLTKKILK